MFEDLQIENFRGIEQGHVTAFKRLTVFVGPNNSGKSTVLDSIYLLTQDGSRGPVYQLASARTNQRPDLYLRYLVPFGRPQATVLRGTISSKKAALVLNLKLAPSQAPQVEIDYNRAGPLPPIEFLDIYNQNSSAFEQAFNRVADQGAADVEQLEKLVQVAFPSVSRLLTRVSDVNAPIPILSLVLPRGSHPIQLSGAGLQNLFLIACLASTLRHGILLLEEPECFQHPSAMKLLARVLTAAAVSKTQIILSTHSMEFIDCLLEAVAGQSVPLDELIVIQRLRLQDGKLSAVAIAGSEAEGARESIELDLR